MCSIYAILTPHVTTAADRALAVRQSDLMKHRGPDAVGLMAFAHAMLVHNRIAVVDVFGGGQPIQGPAPDSAVIANAEIYNHQALRQRWSDYPFRTRSDCEVILPQVTGGSARDLTELHGMFAFVLVRDGGRKFVIARDRIGILSLYWGRAADGSLHVASELKALVDVCDSFGIFPPGHWMTEADDTPQPYIDLAALLSGPSFPSDPSAAALRQQLTRSVSDHLMADVDVGFLLSGGLDSSLVASLGARLLRERGVERPKSYSIGLAGSPDLAAARQVADALGLDHAELVFRAEDGIDALRSTIYHLESYDVTSVRASTPMHLLARRIRADGAKVVLTGDGADELFAGYLYFHYAPDDLALHAELVRKLTSMHVYDCLRVNKTLLSWGVEPRVPFLDNEFVTYAMGIDPGLKRPQPGRIEKHLLREAFTGYLPDAILWRQKEQSSDGVGYGWIDALKAHTERQAGPDRLATASVDFPLHPPRTAEALVYRSIFADLFRHPSAAACAPGGKAAGNATEAAALWLGVDASSDPSGRAVARIHASASAI